ncbi:hypothetical protein BACOVA_01496 [Bacteroides ovatus ATCC 8483]|uniref:Uncharacterized protein n=1 Tax=Bacteroides ovatus (strain ATCC 8483 / DSM 1896 / JCM 5824 / BCRC 10623 / CCUG 4943 / NCTC 11153) TaxID=411476 RepID=A0AAN3D975_BACO1|nr:hypothetical protein BACOVA_01496 [Bacteroides ovatus ATCC 8483]
MIKIVLMNRILLLLLTNLHSSIIQLPIKVYLKVT